MTAPQEPHSLERRGFLVTVLAAACFGIYPSASRMAYAEGANATFVILITTLFRVALLYAAARRKGFSHARVFDGALASAPSGLLQAISIFGIIGSLRYIPGPVMITIVFTHTIMLLFYMHARGEQRMTVLALATSIAALVGITFVVDVYGNLDRLDMTGIALAGLAAVATASRIHAFGAQVKSLPHEIVGTRAFSFAFLFTLCLLAFEPALPPAGAKGWLATVTACLSLGFGTLFTFAALALVGAFRLSLTLKFEPVFTCIFGWLILGEVLGSAQYMGIAIVIGSLLTYQLLDGRRRARVGDR